MTLANRLTFLRLFISPLFLLIYIYPNYFSLESKDVPYALLALFVIAEISDALDGYLARKYEEVTELGKILDPMADSIMRTSAFLTFTQPPVNLPVILIFVFLYRDSVVSTLRTICALKGFALAARASGKIKAVIQAIAIFIILLLMILMQEEKIGLNELYQGSIAVVGFAAIYTLFSGLDYITANRGYITRILKKQPVLE